ncbi:MAG: hypothetical protein FWH03_07370 [Firmicutes bacterium]|nr:hypothetical protein [Bacillota bacterium]
MLCKDCKQTNEPSAKVCLYCGKKLQESLNADTSNLMPAIKEKTRLKILFFFSSAILYAIGILIVGIISRVILVFDIFVWVALMLPILASIGLYAAVLKKRTKKLAAAFNFVFILTGLASVGLAAFFEFWVFDMAKYIFLSNSTAMIVHILFFIISMLLHIAVLIFFITDVKRISRQTHFT